MAPRHAPRLAYLVLLCVSAALTPPEPPRRSLAGVWRLRRDVEGDVIDDVITEPIVHRVPTYGAGPHVNQMSPVVVFRRR